MTETFFTDNLTLIMAKHKTTIKIATSIVTDYADRESNTCILISIFCFRIFVPGKLKGMRTRCQTKILSCFFNVWCKSRALQGMVRPGWPCVTPVVESFSSDLLRAKISYWEESPCCSGYHYCTTSFNKAWTQVLRRFKSCCVSEICDGEDLWQWSRLEIRLYTFCRSTIPQKQLTIIAFRILSNIHDWDLPRK